MSGDRQLDPWDMKLILYKSGPQPPGHGTVPGHREILNKLLFLLYWRASLCFLKWGHMNYIPIDHLLITVITDKRSLSLEK